LNPLNKLSGTNVQHLIAIGSVFKMPGSGAPQRVTYYAHY
jgi:hypothetical protein